MLDDSEINVIVSNEEQSAIGYILGESSEISRNRTKLLDYYNARPYGDELEGQSQVVTTDVADVVEGLLPSMMRIFTQSKNIAHFEASGTEGDREAQEKTILCNHVS